MPSICPFPVVLALGSLAGQALAQELEAAFLATRDRFTQPVGEAFRRTPGAAALLRQKLADGGDDRMLAIEHLQRMPEQSVIAADELLAFAGVAGAEGQVAAVAVGNVAPWWPAAKRAEAQQVLMKRFAVTTTPVDQAALSRSYTRAGLAVTTHLGTIEAMLVSDDPFQIEFGLYMLEGLEQGGKPLLPLLRELAERDRWPVTAAVAGKRRELPCQADWTGMVKDRLYWAVRRIDPADPMALRFYLGRLPKAPAWQQLDFLQMFGRMGREAAPALPAIVGLTRSDNLPLAREAVTVIGMIGVADANAVARLRELAAAADVQLARRARASLRQLVGRDGAKDG